MSEFYRADHYGNHVSGTGVLWGDYGKVRIFHRFFISTAIYRYGIKGLLLGIVGAFPQYLCYVPAIFLLIRWCEDLHRSIYFYHNITGQGKKSLPGRLGRLALAFLTLLFGCVLECFVNPVLLKGFLQFF